MSDSKILKFDKVTTDKAFNFIDFSIEKIEGKEFIKINVVEKLSKEKNTFSIYKEYSADIYNVVKQLKEFENIDSKIFVVYKNGRLKFDFKAN